MKSRWLAYGLALVALMAFGYACKSDGGGEVAFLEVLENAPLDGQSEVPVETRIGFRINATIDPATLTSENVFLTDEDGASVPSTVRAGDAPDIAELLPDEPLEVITSYTVTVTTGLASTGGATLEEDFVWEFRTLDSAWGVDEFVEEIGTGISSEQRIVVDGQSNALTVWEYADAGGSSIWANRYTRVDLWGEPEPIDAGTGFARNPRLAADGTGNALAIWERGEDQNDANIWANRYVVDQGWGTPELIQTDEVTAAQTPSLASDPAGNAIAVWSQLSMDGTTVVVWANRYEPGSGWGTAESIDPAPAPLAPPRTSVGMDADGNAIAVWSRRSVTGEVLWAIRYTLGVGWGTAEKIKVDEATRARNERLNVSATGDAFVVWIQNEDTRDDIWAVRFSGSAWGTPGRIDNYDAGDKAGPDVAVDGMGIAHAVWSQADQVDGGFKNIWANQYSPGSDWGTPQLIEPPRLDEMGMLDPDEDGDATSPRVRVNAAGNAFAVWVQIWDNWPSIWSNRLDPGTGWMDAEVIDSIDRPVKSPRLAVDENRHAHAVWLHSRGNGVDWVRTNRFE